MASGAVRCTALGRRLAGSSKPSSCLPFSKVTSMDRKYTDNPPRAAVEVLSPSDRINRVIKRVNEMLKRGVALVWVIDPEAREIGVHRPGKDSYVLSENQELTGDDVLPDFRCAVADFFKLPGQ
jgi:Uma2 family endonuclease